LTSRARLLDVAIVSVSLATVAGSLEAGIAAFKRYALGRIVFLSPDFWWQTPLAFLIVAVPVAVLGAFLLKLIRKPPSLAFVVGTSAGLLAFVMLLPYTAIGWWAYAILSAGFGRQVSKALARSDNQRILALVRRAGMVAACVIGVATAATTGSRLVAERRATSTLPAPRPEAPNVVIVVLDTVRAANLSLQGYTRPTTPRLESLALSSTVFDQAYSTAPWTLPSHASLFTGLGAGSTRTSWLRPLRDDVPTLAEVLATNGYATGGFVANLLYTSYESGVNRGFAHYDDYRFSWPMVLAHTPLWKLDLKSSVPEARSFGDALARLHTTRIATTGLSPADDFRAADRIVGSFLDWQSTTGGRPFFAFLNLFDAHGPHRAPTGYLERFPGGRIIDKYDAAIAWMDETVGRLVDELARRRVLDKTILIVTSDHGELFGEHGLKGHANSMYIPLLHVPLLIRFPAGVPAGQRVATVVSLRDVAATVVELAGLPGSALEGQSLASTWREPGVAVHGDVMAELEKGRNVDPAFLNSNGPMLSRVGARLHYIVNADGSEEVFDYRSDPAETRNLVGTGDPGLQKEIASLRQGLPRR